MTTINQIDQLEQDNEFSEFCQQLLFRKFNDVFLLTGSCFELPIVYYLANITDVDVIRYRKNICAVAEGKRVPQNFKGTELLIRSEESHQGFARLYTKETGSKCVPYVFREVPEERPAQVSYLNRRATDIKKVSQDDFHGLTRDLVDAIWSPYWPEEANEWKIRARRYGWPSTSTVTHIVDKGCILVAKPHHESQFVANEWRFSFSEAELILILSCSDVQLYIYHILRLIKLDVVQNCGGKEMTILSTYHFKTLMFWACEENPAEFWLPVNIESSIKKLLLVLIEWLIEKQCRNYFIPGNNMLDHLPNTRDFENERKYLLDAAENIGVYIRGIVPFKQGRKNEHALSIPTKAHFAVHLKAHASHIVDPILPGKQRCMSTNAVEQTHIFRSHIVNLFKCLMIHRSLLKTNDFDERLNGILKAKEYFKRANERQIDGFTYIKISSMDNFHIIFAKVLRVSLDDKECVESLEDIHKQHTTVFMKHRHSRQYELCYSRIESTQTYQKLFNLLLNEDIDDPAYCLNAAYEANFYYTAFERNENFLDGCRKAFEICKKFLSYAESVRSSLSCHAFIDVDDLPVIISNQWSAIFDKFIQIVLGFLSLFKAITSRVVRSTHPPNESVSWDVTVQVFPVSFLRYIKFQCNLHLRELVLRDDDFTRYKHVNVSSLVLQAAAHISVQTS